MALVINLDPQANEARWREYRDGVRAKIKPYTRSLIRKILSAATVAADTAAGGEAAPGRVDPELWDLHTYRDMIEDIEGLVDSFGNPVICTPETIDIVCDQVPGFAAWAVSESQLLAKQITARRESTAKNLKRSRGGKHTALQG